MIVDLNSTKRKGFTLIELIVVIAILGILALIAIPRLGGFTSQASLAADNTTADVVGKSLEMLIASDDELIPGSGTLTLSMGADGELGVVGSTGTGWSSWTEERINSKLDELVVDRSFQNDDREATFTITGTGDGNGGVDWGDLDEVDPATRQARPTFSPGGGSVSTGTTVAITSAGADAIYYTTDGSTPTAASALFTTPITINATTTIKAFATSSTKDDSLIASATYTVGGGGSVEASADLSSIAISGSPNNYSFSPSTYTYTGVTVANSINSVTITPTGTGAITVDGAAVASGTASGSISLTQGTPRTVTVITTESGKTPKTYSITITRDNPAVPTLVISSTAPVSGQVGVSYPGHTFTASGGTSPYTYSVTSGSLPSGLTLSSGALSGTPTAQGSNNFTVTVTDSTGIIDSRAFTIDISQAATYAVTVSGANGSAYSGAGDYVAGATVSISATANTGYEFDHWSSTPNVTFADAGNASTTFSMPSEAVSVTATFVGITPVVTSVEITGASSVLAPYAGSALTYSFSAEVRDQFNNPMPTQAVVWSIQGNARNTTINSASGLLSVPTNAQNGSITIRARSSSIGSIQQDKAVTIVKPGNANDSNSSASFANTGGDSSTSYTTISATVRDNSGNGIVGLNMGTIRMDNIIDDNYTLNDINNAYGGGVYSVTSFTDNHDGTYSWRINRLLMSGDKNNVTVEVNTNNWIQIQDNMDGVRP